VVRRERDSTIDLGRVHRFDVDDIGARDAKPCARARKSGSGMPMTTRRHFMSALAALALGATTTRRSQAQARPTIDVKRAGALGNGRLSDLRPLRRALEDAAAHPAGATVYFPPGEYYLGAVDDTYLLPARNLRNVRFVGERATLSCRSLSGSSSMLVLAGSWNVTIEGLAFRDYGLNREDGPGAAGIRLVNDGSTGCENTEISDCTFDSVQTAVVCRIFDGGPQTRIRGLKLSNLSVSRSYYGFSFQDAGDDVVGKGLRCDDVKRSYFPYGVSNHEIELDTRNNATGFTDVLIKCYHKDTSGIRVKVQCRSKRGGDAIVALDHQHEHGRGTIRDIALDLDIDDADCRLNTAVLIRSFDPKFNREVETQNRWDNISIDGDVRICGKTKLIEIASVGKTPGNLRIGPRLSKNPRLPSSFPGFRVSRAA
jgi:hypothetical protein